MNMLCCITILDVVYSSRYGIMNNDSQFQPSLKIAPTSLYSPCIFCFLPIYTFFQENKRKTAMAEK